MSTRGAVVVTFPEPAAAPREADPAPSKVRPPRPRPPRVAKPAGAPVPFGAVLTKKERPLFWKVLSGDQNLPPLALKILQRMVTYYDGELGIVMSYESLARNVGCTPRWVKAQVRLLSQLGIVEVLRGRSKHGRGRDKIDTGAWRVEYFNDDGGCYVAIFGGRATITEALMAGRIPYVDLVGGG
jgi:hypothetical protein